MQACDALAEAHALGIVHRDIKPANLFLTKTRDGLPCIKLLDFGISKVRPREGAGSLTHARSMLGTAHYMPPEQLRAEAVDQRADIWALGVTAFELLTGDRPFEGEEFAMIVARILAEPPTPLSSLRPDVPAALERAVMRCLAKERAERFASVSEFAGVLVAYAPERARAAIDRISRVAEGTQRCAPPGSASPAPPTGDRPGAGLTAKPVAAASTPRGASATNVVVSRTGDAFPGLPMARSGRVFVLGLGGVALVGSALFLLSFARRDTSAAHPAAGAVLGSAAQPPGPSSPAAPPAPPAQTPAAAATPDEAAARDLARDLGSLPDAGSGPSEARARPAGSATRATPRPVRRASRAVPAPPSTPARKPAAFGDDL